MTVSGTRADQRADATPAPGRGLGLGVAAYVLWGVFPLYFPLLEPAGPIEILAHRVLWSAVVMAVVVVATGRRGQLRALVADRRVRLILLVAAATITSNWLTYIYGVTTGRVVETSLGYFVNPLVTVLMGVLVLHERLRRGQWVALGVGLVAVVVLTVDYGRPPWIALILAFSFGTYGLAKKTADAGAVESLTFETAALTPLAVVYLVWLSAVGSDHFGTEGAGHVVLLMTTGVVTAVPLLCFGAAATRVSMTTLGLLQYIAPTLQFVLGLVVFDEDMTPGRWAGFVLVWVALTLFTVEAVRHRRRQLALVAVAGSGA